MRATPLLLLGSTIAAPAFAAGTVSVSVPQLKVAEYHRPYVAIWLEPVGGGPIRTLSLWYQVKKNSGEPGTKWLSDLRAWWRKGGKSMTMPADGISGATRAPGNHTVAIPDDVRPGSYTLNVEAARETGGRELVTLPITLPARPARATGKTELGAITLVAR